MKKEFDYYIFIDFSEDLIGYAIISRNNLKELFPKITKFAHYSKLRHKKEYISSIKKRIEKENILSYFASHKIERLYKNLQIYADILDFIRNHQSCIIFISVDNRQFKSFNRLIRFVNTNKVIIKQESDLVKGTMEYRASLVLDTLLNIKRLKKK